MPIAFIEDLSSVRSVHGILTACSRWLPEIFGADRSSLTVLEGNEFRLLAFTSESGLPANRRIDARNSISGRACMTKKSIVLNAPDDQGSPIIAKLFEAGYRTSVVVPMIADDRILGTLNLSSYRPDRYRGDDIQRIEAVGRWIGSQLLICQNADHMRRLALRDPMTGVGNRRAFMMEAGKHLETLNTGGDGFAVVIFDIDRFKAINDTFGHSAGDRVIEAVTKIVKDLLGPQEFLGRIGGEEFGILIPGATAVEAGMIAERCRSSIAASAARLADLPIGVTASFGCAFAQRSLDSIVDDVLRRADAALYDAKRQGRNKVAIAA